jgi:hypothetical protein
MNKWCVYIDYFSLDGKGNFKFSGILPGIYTVSVSNSDFRCWDKSSQQITVSENVKDVTFNQIGYKVRFKITFLEYCSHFEAHQKTIYRYKLTLFDQLLWLSMMGSGKSRTPLIGVTILFVLIVKSPSPCRQRDALSMTLSLVIVLLKEGNLGHELRQFCFRPH